MFVQACLTSLFLTTITSALIKVTTLPEGGPKAGEIVSVDVRQDGNDLEIVAGTDDGNVWRFNENWQQIALQGGETHAPVYVRFQQDTYDDSTLVIRRSCEIYKSHGRSDRLSRPQYVDMKVEDCYYESRPLQSRLFVGGEHYPVVGNVSGGHWPKAPWTSVSVSRDTVLIFGSGSHYQHLLQDRSSGFGPCVGSIPGIQRHVTALAGSLENELLFVASGPKIIGGGLTSRSAVPLDTENIWVDPDGIGHYFGQVRVIGLQRQETLREVTVECGLIRQLRCSDDGMGVAFVGSPPNPHRIGSVRKWPEAYGKVVYILDGRPARAGVLSALPHEREIRGMDMDGAGGRLAIADDAGNIWAIAPFQIDIVVGSSPQHPTHKDPAVFDEYDRGKFKIGQQSEPATSLALSSDGKTVVSTAGRRVYVWNWPKTTNTNAETSRGHFR